LNSAGDRAANRGTAATLRLLAEGHDAPFFSVTDLLASLGDKGFGLLILLLALPNAVPGPLIPGFSLPFALGIAALGFQLAMGWHAPRLPRWLKLAAIRTERFRRLVDRAEPLLLRLEHWLRPRPSDFTQGTGERLIGIVLMTLSLALALPIPFGNLPVAIGIVIIALGLLESDGAALRLGLGVGFGAVLWNAAVIFAGAELIERILRLF
jgi:hypothetical protein